jgi:SAM-dependent methyltransferase
VNEITGNSEYGTETLEVISEAENFNRWMYETIQPQCSGKILEVGSGIGNVSRFFLQDGHDLTLSDFESGYFPRLKEKFSGFDNLGGIHLIDFSRKNLEEEFPELMGTFDTVFALNVVEHIEDHRQALLNAAKMLKPGGRVIILVPAFQQLYNSFDEQLGHFRRYTAGSLRALLEETGFEVAHSQYFNFIAILGWFFSGKILNKRIIPKGQMRLYDTLVPLWKIIDWFTCRFVGVSVIQSGVKK